jgi:DNA-binding winged helix-turn-helix (wHTH) protein/AraC-like DNA-binding protein
MASKERSVIIVARQSAETHRSGARKLPSATSQPFHCLASCVAQLLERARRELDGDHEAAKVSLLTASHILQSEIERHSEANGSRPLALAGWQMAQVRAFVEKNLQHSIHIRDLSIVAQLSQAHFSRSFKQAFGEPPHAYVVRRRLARASNLMITSPESLTEIALSVGFSDQAHLCRLFRRAFGQSPSSWRREHGGPRVISKINIAPTNAVSFGPFRLYPAQRLVKKGEEPVRLGGRAFDILLALVERAGEVIPHKELIAKVWPNVIVEEISLRVHIASLRKALDGGKSSEHYITNVTRRGYCFSAPVSYERFSPDINPPPLDPGKSVERRTLTE